MGIKETPLNELLVGPVTNIINGSSQILPRTHIMFSHTVKGQTYNMPLLSRFLDPASYSPSEISKSKTFNSLSRSTLIDYELLLNEDGKRAVGFGWFAGGKLLYLTITEYVIEAYGYLTL